MKNYDLGFGVNNEAEAQQSEVVQTLRCFHCHNSPAAHFASGKFKN